MRRGQGGHLAPEPGRLAHISVAGTSTTASIPVAFVYLAARIVDVGVRWAVAVRVPVSVFTVAPFLILRVSPRLVAVVRTAAPRRYGVSSVKWAGLLGP